MIPSIEINNFKVDGKIDWNAYRKAQIRNGESCSRCKEYILFPKGYETFCSRCEDLENPEELVHNTFIRCPNCLKSWDPARSEDYDVFQEGENDVCCHECNFDFIVSTHVKHTFYSPPLIEKEKSNA